MSEPRPDETAKPAIVLHDVRKTFKIKHTQSFKETFIAALKRKSLSTDFNAVDGVSLEVPQGQSVALMGRNGSGKSTTLKMLSGVLRPDAGWIRTRGRIAGLLEVGAGFHPDLTGRENVYLNAAILGMSREEVDERFDDILAFSEIGEFIDTEVKRYSSGMYSRLGFSVAVHTELDVLLVDEILSVGDAQFREKCNLRMLELREQGKTIFVVSHAAGQVKQLCERGVVLQNGRIAFDGPIDEAIEFMKPNYGAPAGGWPIVDAIRKVYDRSPSRYGRAVQERVRIEENGGGYQQEFESGLITFSEALGEGFGVAKGSFTTEYLARGGAAGPWGFIAGEVTGTVKGGDRALRFQHGTAGYDPVVGVHFTERSA
ncbi:sugar ABC transporter ATP-binding protein [Leucobacter massiliensis]|uniref:Sugar ABC transporter ATP-binding protein n=1 Tax=Leucobacter massiliensis TaxID=1686285 RepID=A0A2S9QL63_9MICO|nr:sugar ABC transporter ATP-binding protein [Leucobacter massiliensis]